MNFSISDTIKQAYALWKNHIVFTWMIIGVMAAVSIVFGIITPRDGSVIITLVSTVVRIFLELGAMALLLKLVRMGQEGDIKEMFGQTEILPQALLGQIIYGFMILVGMILLIIPGIYVAVRFMFLPYIFVDKKLGWKEALSEASRLTEGRRGDLFLFSLALVLLNLVGVLLLLVGLLVTIPVSMIATTMMYENLKKEKDGTKESVTTESAEVTDAVIEAPAATPEPAA